MGLLSKCLEQLLPIPHKGKPSDWLPPFIADALNKVINYTTRMTQKVQIYVNWKLMLWTFIWANLFDNSVSKLKVTRNYVAYIYWSSCTFGSGCIYFPYLADVRLYTTGMLWPQPCIMPDLGAQARDRGSLGVDNGDLISWKKHWVLSKAYIIKHILSIHCIIFLGLEGKNW